MSATPETNVITRTQAKTLCDRILDLAGKRKVEVLLHGSDHGLTRLADNVIHQNLCQRDLSAVIRMLVGKRVSRAQTARFDAPSLAATLARCEAMAKAQQADPKMLPLPRPQQYRPSRAYAGATAKLTPQDRLQSVQEATAVCRKAHLRAAGICSSDTTAVALANTSGLFAYHRSTSATVDITAMGDGHSGWAAHTHKDARSIDAACLARRAADKALASANARAIEPGPYTVVFEHAAVADFLLPMAYACFGAQPVMEGSSFLSGRMGDKVFGDNVTIMDDAYNPIAPGLPFDFEGMPRLPVTLVDRGVAAAVVHDRRTARQAGAKSTGHALPQPNPHGPLPINLALAAGNSSLDDMIASTARGLLVTHLHYTNIVDPKRLVLTGMTRDGTFLIEDGKVSHPVRNLRFTQSVPELLCAVEQISSDRRQAKAFFGGGFVVPALKVHGFTFTSTTDF